MVAQEIEALTDEELVGRFVQSRDAAAFEILIWRHGPMVWTTCRRILRHQHDIEDAFQATFLALARTARSISNRQSAGGWLHRVAVNAALKLKAKRLTGGLAANIPAPTGGGPDGGELTGVLDEELNRLPERLRSVFVLCCLEGMTSPEAARELGCPAGTVDSRLHAARARLRDRLSRRGFGPGAFAGLITTTLPPATASAAAIRMVSGIPSSPAVELLASQARRMMMQSTLATKSILGGALAVILAGAAWVAAGPRDNAPAVVKPLVAAPAPRQVLRGEGKIVLWREGHPVAIRPSTKEMVPLATGVESKYGNLWLSPDGKRLLIYQVNRLTVLPEDPEKRDRCFFRAADEKETVEIKVEGVSLCHSFWGADSQRVYGYGLVIPNGQGPFPEPDLTADFINWSFDVTTGKVMRLKVPGNVSVLDRSPDGKAFLVLRYEKVKGDPRAYSLGLLPTDGGPFVRLTKEGEATAGGFRFSPDGRSALGTVYRNERGDLVPELVTFDLRTRARTVVAVPKDGRVSGACWSPDGKQIAFIWETKAGYEKRNKVMEGPVVLGREKYELTISIARPDGSDARNIHAEDQYWCGSIDWQ